MMVQLGHLHLMQVQAQKRQELMVSAFGHLFSRPLSGNLQLRPQQAIPRVQQQAPETLAHQW